jgi:sulfur-carrier protein
MAQVHFTAHLRSVAARSPVETDGAVVRDALRSVFLTNPQLRSYVLDEQGALRRHVCVFLDGERLPHNEALDAPLKRGSEIYVMQALSGG